MHFRLILRIYGSTLRGGLHCVMAAVSSFEKERRALKAVLLSESFSRSPHLAKLLTYLCDKYFEGRSAELKEYTIAVDALGRAPDHDDTGSAAARVQMHRLRAKLREYYEHEGAADALRLVLKPGVYTPQFVMVGPSPGAPEAIRGPTPFLLRLQPLWKQLQRLRWALGALVLASSVTGILLFIKPGRHESLPAAAQPNPVSMPVVPGPVSLVKPRISPDNGIRILPGSNKPSTVDALGNIWLGDRYFTGGETEVTPPALLGLTSDPVLFETYRRGDFTYKIPLARGFYEVHLYFADFLGPRLALLPDKTVSDFILLINEETPWRHESHPFSYGTQPPLQSEQVFAGLSPKDGYLSLHFIPTENFAFLNALMILPTPDNKPWPVRIVAQEGPVTDQIGQVWIPDRYYTAGTLAVHATPITGTSDPKLFAGERHGNFRYIVPVAEGSYTVKLYFVESWFGAGAPGGGGVGSRVFRVDGNGDNLLRHFDILAETRVAGRPLVKTFHSITPDADGHIVLSFIPIENEACVNAIEITGEGADTVHSDTKP